MATSYTGLRVQDTYNAIIKIGDNSNLTATPKLLSDGLGNDSPLYLSGTRLGIGISPAYQFHTSGNAKIGGNLIISGNLTVNGTLTYLNVEDLQVEDPLIKLAKDNTSNTLDIGFFGKYVESATTKYTGLFWDASTDKFRLYEGLQVEPTTTVDVTGTGYTRSLLNADLEGNVTGTVSSLSNHDTNDLVEGSVNLYYTNARADARVNLQTGANLDLSSKDTDDLSEGTTNLYFTTARARASFTEGTGVTITDGEIAIGQDVATDSNVTFNNIAGEKLSLGTTNTGQLITLSGAGTTTNGERGIRIISTSNVGFSEIQFKSDDEEFRIGVGGSGVGTPFTNKFYIYSNTASAAVITVDESKNTVFSGSVTGIAPTSDLNFATKKYVDDNIPTITTPALSAVLAVGNTSGSNDLIIQDNDELVLGSSTDFRAYHNETNTLFRINTGDLIFNSFVDDGDIKFQLDNGANPAALTEYMRLDGGLVSTVFSKPTIHTNNTKAYFGSSALLSIDSDGSNGEILQNTGDLYITNSANDKSIIFRSDDGSGGLVEYFRLDGSTNTIPFGRSPHIVDNLKLYFGNDTANDASIKWDSTASQLFIDGETNLLSTVNFAGLITSSYSGTSTHVLQNATSNGTVLQLNCTGDSTSLYLQGDHIYASGTLVIGNASSGVNLYRATTHTFQEGTVTFDDDVYINYNQNIYFNRDGSTADYSNIIGATNYPTGGYNAANQNFWIKAQSKGGFHIVLNSDGTDTSAENAFDDFVIFQGEHDGTPRFRVSNVGSGYFSNKLGVGTASTSAYSTLEVGKPLGTTTELTISGIYTGGNNGPILNFRSGHPSNTNVWNMGHIQVTDDGNYNGRMHFMVTQSGGNSGSSPVIRATLKATGNFGVGTVAPYERLVSDQAVAALGATQSNSSQGHATIIDVDGTDSRLMAVDWGAAYKDLLIQASTINLMVGTGSTASALSIANNKAVSIATSLSVAGNNVVGFSGSWNAANMPGSRFGGYSSNGGEVVFQSDNPSSGRMSVMTDGQFYAGENGGFYSLYSGNDYSNRKGFYADSSGVLQFNSSARYTGKVQGYQAQSSSAGDHTFFEMLYAGGWSQNTEGLAAINVTDGGGTIVKFGGTYNGSQGVFVVTNLYSGGYGATGDLFRVTPSGISAHSGTELYGKMQVGKVKESSRLTIGGYYYGGGGQLTFRSGHPSNSVVWNTAEIFASDDGNYNGRLEFRTGITGPTNEGTTTKMVIKASGNVGIGTMIPWLPLMINKASNSVSSGNDSSFRLCLSNSDQTNNNWSLISFTDGDSQPGSGAIGIQYVDHTNNYGDLNFITRGSDGYGTKFKIPSNGGLQIFRASDPFIQFYEGSTNRGDIFVDTSLDNLIVRAAAGHGVQIKSNGNTDSSSEGIYLTTNDRVGINTKNPNCGTSGYSSNTAFLHVYDNTNGNKPTIHVSCHDYDEASLILSENSGNGARWGTRIYYEGLGDNFFNIETSDGGTVSHRLTIDRYGKFGYLTSSPQQTFDVRGKALFNGDTSTNNNQIYDGYVDGSSAYLHSPAFTIRQDSSRTGGVDEAPVGLCIHNQYGADNTMSKLSFASREVQGGGNTVTIAGIMARKTSGISGSWANGELSLFTKAGSAFREGMIMDSAGRSTFYYTTKHTKGIRLNRAGTPSTGISWYNDTYYNWQNYMASAGTGNCGPNGNLTAPGGLTSVSSWALRSRMEGVSTYGWLWETGGSGGGGATASAKMELGATNGTLRVTGDMVAYASDERLKTNIVKIDNALEKVKQINGVEYDWVDNIKEEYDFHPNNMHEVGVLAQEIEKVLPEAVLPAPMNGPYTEKTGKDHKFLTVKYERIVPLLIESIKELTAKVEALENKNCNCK